MYLILRHEPVAAKDAIWKARREGIARRTLDRAKQVLRVKSERKASNWSWQWQWRLPDEVNQVLHYFQQKYAALDAESQEEDEDAEALAAE